MWRIMHMRTFKLPNLSVIKPNYAFSSYNNYTR